MRMFPIEMSNMSEAREVVSLDKVSKSLGGQIILDGISTFACEGTIYALLGASGCGKTTLFSHIVGSKIPDSGVISVLGEAPGANPDKIGYMPQDVALVEEFSIAEMIRYFGLLAGMNDEEIKERSEYLKEKLELPQLDSVIKYISGGQKRRVSFAVALCHDPQILILDEPTVGQDPELRKQIWDYLQLLARNEKKTIFIATHYVEEARQSDVIGLMRNGKLLEVGPPNTLLEKYNSHTIEELFVILSHMQEVCSDPIKIDCIPLPKVMDKPTRKRRKNGMVQIRALLIKNSTKITRNLLVLLVFFLSPLVSVLSFSASVGKIPENLKVGLLNHEIQSCDSINASTIRRVDDVTCELVGLSCWFLNALPSGMKNFVNYSTASEGQEAVTRGQIPVFVEIPKNFSKYLQTFLDQRIMYLFITDSDLEQMKISVFRDRANFMVSRYIEKTILETFATFIDRIDKECGFNGDSNPSPIRFKAPIYGSNNESFRDFATPGFLITSSAILAMSLSSLCIIIDRTDGVWDRSLIAGASKCQMVFAHFVSMAVVNIMQNVLYFVVLFLVFDVECRGSLWTVLLFHIYQGAAPISFGLFLSVVFKTVNSCLIAGLGVTTPMIALSGVLWPRQGMPHLLEFLSYYLLFTSVPVETVSNITQRGWGLTHYHVAKGFLNVTIWTAIFILACFIILKYEKY